MIIFINISGEKWYSESGIEPGQTLTPSRFKHLASFKFGVLLRGLFQVIFTLDVNINPGFDS